MRFWLGETGMVRTRVRATPDRNQFERVAEKNYLRWRMTIGVGRLTHPCDSGSGHRALRQQFRDLDGVERGALQQLIGRDEHCDRVAGGIAEILADAADQNVVLA